MKRKSTLRSAFSSRRGLIAVFLAGALLALFAIVNLQALTQKHATSSLPHSLTPSGVVQEAWVAIYDGPGHRNDQATAVAVDNSGNVYVTGGISDQVTGFDYVTIKYNSVGQQQWVARYDGPGHSTDLANAIAIDSSGNVYVTGASFGSDNVFHYATVKYNSAGQEQWVARYNGPGIFGGDQAQAIAIDTSGNVYVTGTSYGSNTFYDYATVKYNSAGQQQWVARYNGPANDDDAAKAIAADNSGNVYVTGWSVGSGTFADYATIKYDTAGEEQWVARYNGPGNYIDEAAAIAVDNLGNVYVTGYSLGSGTYYDYATIKYNSLGRQQWVVRYNGPASSIDEAVAIALDDSRNVYATGYSVGSDGLYEYTTIKYDILGRQQWVARYGTGNGGSDATAIAVDGSDNVYVTGESVGPGTGLDYATVKYDSTGQEQWVVRYDRPAHFNDTAAAITVDGSGNVYVTGWSTGSGGDYDYATIKYVQAVTPTPTPSGTPTPTPPRGAPTPRSRPTPAPRL